MKLRLSLRGRSILTILVMAMLGVGLACAGEKAPPTSPPTATLAATATTAPTATLVPTATATLVPGAPTPTATAVPTATATAVPEPTATSVPLTWIEKYMKSPGYDPAWGQPQTGGTFVFGGNRDGTKWNPNSFGSGCYTHGCNGGLGFNSLLRIDVWQGKLDVIEGDLARSWNMSGGGLTLTFQLQEGVLFHDNPNVPAEYNGGKIRGDEFVCEDAKASYERMAWPPAWETGISASRMSLSHLESMSCPDGPRGYTFVMQFNVPLARTVQTLAAGLNMGFTILDKEWIDWVNALSEAAGRSVMDNEVPDNFYRLTGTGPFVAKEAKVSVSTTWVRNPSYWREGLPLLDRWQNVVIKDMATRFTALATGNIHFYGEGSYSFTAGQAEQALRDFRDKIVVGSQMNMWARTLTFNASRPPFNDGRVRHALHLALDRQEWKEFRRVRVGNTVIEGTKLAFHLPPDTFYGPTEEELKSWPGYRIPKQQDLDEANALLDEVFGAGNRPETTCMAVAENPSDVDGCLFVIDQFKRNLGIKVTSAFVDAAVKSQRDESGAFGLIVGSSPGNTATGDPDDAWPRFLLKEYVSTGYGAHISLPALWVEMPDKMAKLEVDIMAQSRELDIQKRWQMVRELERRILDEHLSYWTILGWTHIFPAWGTKVKGMRGYDLYSNTKAAMWERIWLAK